LAKTLTKTRPETAEDGNQLTVNEPNALGGKWSSSEDECEVYNTRL